MSLLWIVPSYFLGSIPTSYVAGRLGRGIDLRDHGSRNLGATNVYRVMGWRYAIPVALFDVVKGAIPVVFFGPRGGGAPAWLPAVLGAAAVVGHVYSPFLAFRGGKGVATACGAFLALAPLAVVVAVPLWGLALWLTGYVSLASLIAAAAFPALVWITTGGAGPTLVASVVLALLIWYTHRTNIGRLLAGTENRFRTRGGGSGPRGPRGEDRAGGVGKTAP